MVPRNNSHLPRQARWIDRHRIWQRLEIAAMVTLFLAACGGETADTTLGGDVTDQNASDPTQAVFYETTAQCQADLKQQQTTYTLLLQDYQNSLRDTEPVPPAMQPQDCAAQMLAARQEHEASAPIYQSLADCQAEGTRCEKVPATPPASTSASTPASTPATTSQTSQSTPTSGYRPVFGGTYLYPDSYGDNDPDWVYVNYNGISHPVYPPRVVYQSLQPNQLITPHGRVVAKKTPGRVLVPRHTTVAAPARPVGTAAKGTIAGRSRQGFGSTYKSTGKGGK